MVYITVNTKGGVGKSLTSINLACLLHFQNRNFRIVELDNSNNSILFNNSDFLTKDKAISLTLDKKDRAISDMLFDVMGDPELDYILDVEGGDGTLRILDALKSLQIEKTYLVPTLKIKKYLINARKTYEYINDPQNTFFVLNQYIELQNVKSEFKYFYGDKSRGIKPESPLFASAKVIYMPWGDMFQVAEDDEQTVLDLANISRDVSEGEARAASYELAAGDRDKFATLIAQYQNSQEAQLLFAELQESTAALFE